MNAFEVVVTAPACQSWHMTQRSRLRLGIDLDGVVADFNAGWIERYNAQFGSDLLPEHVDIWDAPTLLTHFTNMSEFWSWARTAGGGASIFRVLQPYRGAIAALERLSERDDIVIVTTKPRFAVHDTFEWLAEHRVPTTEVHIVDDKSEVACDVYLDDADHNIEALLAARPDSLVCRFVRPWSTSHVGAIDIDDWVQFEHQIEQFRESVTCE
jgi:5'(3')-deoxyribonucleotidase